jgi:hypothetical protein
LGKLLSGFVAVALFIGALGLYALLTMECLNEEQRTMYVDVFGGPHLLGTYFDDSWLAPTYWITCSRTTRRNARRSTEHGKHRCQAR